MLIHLFILLKIVLMKYERFADLYADKGFGCIKFVDSIKNYSSLSDFLNKTIGMENIDLFEIETRINKNTLRKYFNGQRTPKEVEIFAQLANAYGIVGDWLEIYRLCSKKGAYIYDELYNKSRDIEDVINEAEKIE